MGLRGADRPGWGWVELGRLSHRHRPASLAVSFSVAFLALMLDTRGDDHHSPAEARRAQADEEEKEKLAHCVHYQIISRRLCIGATMRCDGTQKIRALLG